MKNTLLILFVICFMLNGSAQELKEIDSLNKILEETDVILKKIEICHILSVKHHNINLEKAKEYARQGLNLSRLTGENRFQGDLFRSLGDIAVKEDSLDLAGEYFQTAHQFFSGQNRQHKLADVLTVLGNIDFVRDRFTDAMNHYLNAIEIAEENDLEVVLPVLYLNIGAINNEIENNQEAIKYYSRALEGFKVLDDSLSIAHVLHNLGAAYYQAGDKKLAKSYFEKSKEIYFAYGNTGGVASCYMNLAAIERFLGSQDKSIELTLQAMDYLKSENIHYHTPTSIKLAQCYINLGANYLDLGKQELSLEYFRKGYGLATKNKQISAIANASEGLSQIYELKGDTDSAFHYYKMFKTYSDSLTNKENIKKLAYLDAKLIYERRLEEEKQQRIREDARERQNYLILALIIVGLVSVVIVMVLLLKLSRNRTRRALLEQESLKKELEIRNKELTTHVMYQVKKNEFILSILKKLQTGLYRLKSEDRDIIQEIIRELERDTDDSSWQEFEVRFHRVHSDFNKKLLRKYPDLTPNELRLCAFLRLNMSTKEIAAITYQTTNSIDTARSRLRQKLGISKDENLTAFLSQF